MNRQHYLETIEVVLAWDLPEEVLADAINQQLMQTVSFEDDHALDHHHHFSLSSSHSLHFATHS